MRISVVNHKDLESIDGGTTRVRSIVHGLANRGHQVYYSCYGDGGYTNDGPVSEVRIRKPDLRILRKLGRSFYGGDEGEAAIDILSCNHPIASLRLGPILSSSGLVQIEQIWSALYPLLYARLKGKVSLLDDHNVEAVLAQRLSSHVSNRKLFAAWVTYVSVLERVCCMLADKIVVTSDLDKYNLSRVQHVPEKKIRVIPNGTDPAQYKPDPALGAETRRTLRIPEEAPVLTFVGRSSYPPNRLAVEYIKNTLSASVWEKYPQARFLIVSRELPEAIVKDADPRFIVISDKRDYPYINASDLCLAPLAVGGGTRIKILNYLACGKPVVSTPVGVEGIPVVADRHIAIADLDGFPETVSRHLAGTGRMAEMGSRAREFVVENCCWERSVSMFEDLHQELASKNGA